MTNDESERNERLQARIEYEKRMESIQKKFNHKSDIDIINEFKESYPTGSPCVIIGGQCGTIIDHFPFRRLKPDLLIKLNKPFIAHPELTYIEQVDEVTIYTPTMFVTLGEEEPTGLTDSE